MGRRRELSDPLIRAVAAHVDATKLIAPGAGVVVGVSGGADSVALLAVLHDLSNDPKRGYLVSIVHLNHGLRSDAGADAAWVADLARRWSIPCICERRDVGSAARKRGQGIEEAARSLRYEFFAEAAAQVGAGYVAVGHHADDQVETVLHRIVRGTHLRGLRGMAATRPLGGSGLRLIRPFLPCRRRDIEAFLTRQGMQWRSDHTNADTAYRRNLIRHEVLPLLREKLNPRADEAILRLAEAAGEVQALVDHLAEETLAEAVEARDRHSIALHTEAMTDRPRVLQMACLRTALERIGAPLRTVGAETLARLCDLICSGHPEALDLPGGFRARIHDGRLVIGEAAPPTIEAAPPDTEEMPLVCPGRSVLWDGREIHCETMRFDAEAFASHCRTHRPGTEMIDADKVVGALQCRPRRQGDALVPLGAPGSQSVSDFLTNRKLPPEARREVFCISDEMGIVYVAPLQIANRVRLSERSQRVLRLTVSGQPGA